MFNKIFAFILLAVLSFAAVAYDKPEKPVQDEFDNHSKYIHAMLIYEAMITRKHNRETHFRADTKEGVFRFYPYKKCKRFDNPGDFRHHGTFTFPDGYEITGCWEDGRFIEFRHGSGITKVSQENIHVVNPAVE